MMPTRLPLPVGRALFPLAALAILGTLSPSPAKEIEGVNVPEQVKAGNQTLPLRGTGVRSVSFLGFPVKVYVAGFYSPQPVTSLDNALAAPKPLQFDFTFLRAVGQQDVTKAWNAQFATSNTFTYPSLDADLAKFVGSFGPLQSGDVESVRLMDNETQVYDKGQLKGTIPGKNFQKAFLSLWLGSNPVTPELKNAFLGK